MLAELAARDPKVVVITHTRNFGSQSAFTSGMAIATGDAVVLLDGDLQDPPELIEEFHDALARGLRRRLRRAGQARDDSVHARRLQALLPRLPAGRLRARPVDAGDFSLIDRRVVDALNALPENNRFVRGLRAWVGFRQTGVPYVRPERPFGRTTNSLLRNLGWARKAVISFSYAPLDLITLLAFMIVVASTLVAVAEVVLRHRRSGSRATRVSRRSSSSILFLGGIQLLCLSIIGSYLAGIYDEVKHRPAYIVDSVTRDGRELKVDRGEVARLDDGARSADHVGDRPGVSR